MPLQEDDEDDRGAHGKELQGVAHGDEGVLDEPGVPDGRDSEAQGDVLHGKELQEGQDGHTVRVLLALF